MENNLEQSLIVEIQSGNKKAEEEFYVIYKNKISRLLRKKFPNNSDHEDDVSEILMKIFESIKTYDATKSKFSSWAINIMRNYMIDKSRVKRPIYVNFTNSINNSDNFDFSTQNSSSGTLNLNCSLTSSSLFMNEPASLSNSPHDDLEVNDSLNFISNKIGISEFSILSLKFKDGYDYKEIGKEMNLKESQISNKVNYTRSKLKKKPDGKE